jgi:hypothetical protein
MTDSEPPKWTDLEHKAAELEARAVSLWSRYEVYLIAAAALVVGFVMGHYVRL